MGRPPASLEELYRGTLSYGSRTFDSDGDGTNDAELAGGWRGPYLHLRPGQERILDGWARPFEILSQETASGASLVIKSAGADGALSDLQDGWDRDLTVQIAPTDYCGSLVLHVRERDATGAERDPSNSENIVLRLYRVGSAAAEPLSINKGTFQASAVLPAGTVAARALQIDGGTTVKKSPVYYMTLRPRSTWYQKLVLQ
jgi:hypothetical protein